MQYSAGHLISFVVLLVGTACIIASVATDYWEYREIGAYKTHRGLYRGCKRLKAGILSGQHCWYRFKVDIDFEDEGKVDVSHKDIQAWEVAVLGLMGASGVLSILCLLFSPCCCNRCGCCLTFWVLLATLFTACGVGLFAYQSKAGKSAIIEVDDGGLSINIMDFGWSFWLAVGGGACQLLATLGFGVSRARQHSYSHTI